MDLNIENDLIARNSLLENELRESRIKIGALLSEVRVLRDDNRELIRKNAVVSLRWREARMASDNIAKCARNLDELIEGILSPAATMSSGHQSTMRRLSVTSSQMLQFEQAAHVNVQLIDNGNKSVGMKSTAVSGGKEPSKMDSFRCTFADATTANNVPAMRVKTVTDSNRNSVNIGTKMKIHSFAAVPSQKMTHDAKNDAAKPVETAASSRRSSDGDVVEIATDVDTVTISDDSDDNANGQQTQQVSDDKKATPNVAEVKEVPKPSRKRKGSIVSIPDLPKRITRNMSKQVNELPMSENTKNTRRGRPPKPIVEAPANDVTKSIDNVPKKITSRRQTQH